MSRGDSVHPFPWSFTAPESLAASAAVPHTCPLTRFVQPLVLIVVQHADFGVSYCSLAVFGSFQLLVCPFQTFGNSTFSAAGDELAGSGLGFVVTGLSCASGIICTSDRPSSAVMRCSESSFVAFVHSNDPSDFAHTSWTVRTSQLGHPRMEFFCIGVVCGSHRMVHVAVPSSVAPADSHTVP